MFYNNDFKIGILGGGQLGRMFIKSAIPFDPTICILDPSESAPCADIANEFTQGDFNDYQTVLDFGKDKDVLTIEIEHVNVEALEELEKQGVKVYPKPSTLRIVQDKGLQKEFYLKNGIATADFRLAKDKNEVFSLERNYPYIQKLRRGGYDGKGVQVIKSENDERDSFDAPVVLEDFVDFEKEISVIIARNDKGDHITYPLVELEFNPEANLVEFLFSPARTSDQINAKAKALAEKVADTIDLIGILAVEMFVTKDGEVLVNEIAPRTHNSGHHSIEGNITSQFEQHFRSVLNLPLGNTDITRPAVMVNLLGEPGFSGDVHYEGLEEALKMKDVHIHLYGKKQTRPMRKMGHVTVLSDDLSDAIDKALKVKNLIKVKSKDS